MLQPAVIPVAKALYLCDGCIGFAHQKSDLIGLFNAIRPLAYPHVQPQFVVFAQLVNGLGQVSFFIDIRFASTGHLVHTTNVQTIRFANRAQVKQVAYTIQGCKFSRGGRYLVEFICDGQWIADATIDLLS